MSLPPEPRVHPDLWAMFKRDDHLTAGEVRELQGIIDRAFRAGQERMRERAAREMEACFGNGAPILAERIRTLPLEEE